MRRSDLGSIAPKARLSTGMTDRQAMPSGPAYVAARSRVWPGQPYPLGATWDGMGVNFALFSTHAERVELCLFDAAGVREIDRVRLPEHTDEVWHGFLPGGKMQRPAHMRLTGRLLAEGGHATLAGFLGGILEGADAAHHAIELQQFVCRNIGWVHGPVLGILWSCWPRP